MGVGSVLAMNGLLIAALVVVGVVVIALLVTAPLMKKSEVAAVSRAKELAGGDDAVRIIEARAVGFGTDPEEAGGLRGMGVLAASTDRLVFVTWRPLADHVIDRATVTGVDCSTANLADASKAMVEVTATVDGEEVTSSFRVPDPIEWLDELGYDWGPEGKPELEDD